VAFGSADIVLQATTLVLAYFLLPPAVRFANLNYLQTPVEDIRARWEGLAPSEMLASGIVLLTGSALRAVVRLGAGRDAASLALERMRAGDIVFEPQPIIRSDLLFLVRE
jgi:hypothetical protein